MLVCSLCTLIPGLKRQLAIKLCLPFSEKASRSQGGGEASSREDGKSWGLDFLTAQVINPHRARPAFCHCPALGSFPHSDLYHPSFAVLWTSQSETSFAFIRKGRAYLNPPVSAHVYFLPGRSPYLEPRSPSPQAGFSPTRGRQRLCAAGGPGRGRHVGGGEAGGRGRAGAEAEISRPTGGA